MNIRLLHRLGCDVSYQREDHCTRNHPNQGATDDRIHAYAPDQQNQGNQRRHAALTLRSEHTNCIEAADSVNLDGLTQQQQSSQPELAADSWKPLHANSTATGFADGEVTPQQDHDGLQNNTERNDGAHGPLQHHTIAAAGDAVPRRALSIELLFGRFSQWGIVYPCG